MFNPAEEFRSAIAAAGFTPPGSIEPDRWVRFPGYQKGAKNRAGWCLLFKDLGGGVYGDHSTGLKCHWSAVDGVHLTHPEREAQLRRLDAFRQQRDEERRQRQRQTAREVAGQWEAARPAVTHPYLTTKGVQAYGLRVEGDLLLVPMRDAAGTLHSLQFIAPDGRKRFPQGGRVKGCYHAIGTPEGVVIICEGYATGASLHEATGQAVAVAFHAGNLPAVATALRSKYPGLNLILAADDDWQTEGNPGRDKAEEAASAVGALVAIPVFPEDRPENATDFNDLHQLVGLDAVKSCIAEAQRSQGEHAAGAYDASSAGDLGWPEPTPLPDPLPPVQPFEPALLPEALRDSVWDIAYRMQCPPDFSAVGMLVGLSSLVGARAVVAPKAKDDWKVVPNLWGMIVGRPGVMKSPALDKALKPLHQLEAVERELWQIAHRDWKLQCKVQELAAKHNEKKAGGVAVSDPAEAMRLLQSAEVPDEPKARRYIVNDSTVEKLGDLLIANPWGLLVYRDELYGLLCSMDKPGQEGARGFYLTAYDGNQGHAVDRISRGESFVPRVCLALLGGIQPSRVQGYVRDAVAGGAGDDGLLQRFGLAVWPDVTQAFEYVDRLPDTEAMQSAYAVFDRLNKLEPAADDEPQVWRFSAAAQALFEQWLIMFETEIRGEELHPALVSHLSKYRKLIPALALIFSLVDTPESNFLIHERELLRALEWGDYLRTHAERLYAAAVIPETAGAQTLLTKLRSGKLCDADGVLHESFSPRMVAVKHWTGLGNPEAVCKAADLLADYGWLRRELVPTGARGGRPSERYLIHPRLIQGGGR